ncbi:MAG: NAD-dependent epimerase/dehydratase family protein [Saccharofermentans sp.]|nr:NAD-dependent epimerase/dehydratase family protein [Saccharofermentans sp.]
MASEFLKEDLQRLSTYLIENGFSGSTFLVTGATGLLGSLCIKSFLHHNSISENKIRIYALARSEEKVNSVFKEEIAAGLLNENIKFIYCDIRDPLREAFSCDYIIHTANSTASRFFITNPVDVLDSIYMGTKNILDFGKTCNVKGIVYLSSMEAFGQIANDKRLKESDLGFVDLEEKRSCYPEGKRVAELMCKLYSEQFGVPVKVARLAQTFGAGVSEIENRVFAQFLRSAVKGENIVLHTVGQSVGNYCYTADVIEGIFLLLKSGCNGETYTLVNEDTTMTITEMAVLVANEFSNGCSDVVFDISNASNYGYAADTKMRLSADKILRLGWTPRYGLSEMYRRMLPDLK